MFMDSHCHLNFPVLISHIADFLKEAEECQIRAWVVPSTQVSDFREISFLTDHFTGIYGAFGLHPMIAHTDTACINLDNALAKRNKKIIALGEIGLEKGISTPWGRQLDLFRNQLTLANKYDLPVILHTRKTQDNLYYELKKAALPRAGIIHAFSGSYQQAINFIDLGYKLGVSGIITYLRAHKTREALKKVPLSALVLETDAPGMPPCGYQGQPNQPKRLIQVYRSLCDLRSEDAVYIKEQIYINTQKIFFFLNRRGKE